MKIHFNTMVKNEEDLLSEILPIWKQYPVDKFVFYDDGSSDNTIHVINNILPSNRVIILSKKNDKWNESYNRSLMLEYSRENGADYVFSIDCDELLSANFNNNYELILENYENYNLLLYWYNVVEDTLSLHRQDPSYLSNYRSFILPMKYTAKFDLSLWKYHSPRTPDVYLQPVITKNIGVIHLQAINKKFYALKQLWYKHWEFVNYNHSVQLINERYDTVVNNLVFNPIDTPMEIIENIQFDSKVFDSILEKKGYLKYIKDNYVKELVTFGNEYL